MNYSGIKILSGYKIKNSLFLKKYNFHNNLTNVFVIIIYIHIKVIKIAK